MTEPYQRNIRSFTCNEISELKFCNLTKLFNGDTNHCPYRDFHAHYSSDHHHEKQDQHIVVMKLDYKILINQSKGQHEKAE